VRIIRTDKQKENLAKFFWDMSKVTFTVLVIGPYATPGSVGLVGLLIGIVIGFLLALWGYLLDGMEVSK
jgi:xanthine/uracil permease